MENRNAWETRHAIARQGTRAAIAMREEARDVKRLEAERLEALERAERLERATPYTGPLYTPFGREIAPETVSQEEAPAPRFPVRAC